MAERLQIVLGADIRYSEQVVTTLKSVCYHNKDVDFYLLNRDFPAEWFTTIQRKIAPFNSTITNLRIDNQLVTHFKTYPQISFDHTYFRYFIPQLLAEDKVLYLDCDVVVTGTLAPLFSLELGHYFIAGAIDPIAKELYQRDDEFNTGVLLINNKLWRAERITEKALAYSSEDSSSLKKSDQEVLNALFRHRWLKLNRGMNYQLGMDAIRKQYPHIAPNDDDFSQHLPLIAHYSTMAKPWKKGFRTRLRELYWFYYALDWADIIPAKNRKLMSESKKTVAVITSSTGREELERTILSIKAQTYPVQHYIIVDGEQFAENVRAIVDKYPEVITVYLPMNTGANGKVNSTINAIAPFLVKEDYLCYLDDDNWVEPNHIESLVKTLENSSASYVYALRNFADKDSTVICPDNWESVGEYESIPSDVAIDITYQDTQYKFTFSRSTKYHIDTNCYFFPRQLALLLALAWENGGKVNDKEVLKVLQEMGKTGQSTGMFTVNYTYDFNKAYPVFVSQLKDLSISDNHIEELGKLLMKGLGDMALARYQNQAPWLV